MILRRQARRLPAPPLPAAAAIWKGGRWQGQPSGKEAAIWKIAMWADALAPRLGDVGLSAASTSTSAAASKCMAAQADVRKSRQSERKLGRQGYSAESGMAFVELAQKYDYLEFENRLKAVPGVLRVEHSKNKPPGKHYVPTYLRVFTATDPKRFIQMELTTHGHRKDTNTCSALYFTPPSGLQEKTKRILHVAVAGWELNPLTDSQGCRGMLHCHRSRSRSWVRRHPAPRQVHDQRYPGQP